MEFGSHPCRSISKRRGMLCLLPLKFRRISYRSCDTLIQAIGVSILRYWYGIGHADEVELGMSILPSADRIALPVWEPNTKTNLLKFDRMKLAKLVDSSR